MNNLLSQSFKSECIVTPGPHDGPGPGESVAVRIPGACSPGLDLTAFNAGVQGVQRALELQAHLMLSIQSMHEESKRTVKAASVKDLARRIQRSITEASRMALPIKDHIVALQRSNEQNRSYPESVKGTPIDRHRSAVTLSLTCKLKDNVDKLTQLRKSIEREQRAIIARRIRVVTGQDLPDADLDSLLRNGLGDEVLQAAVAQQGEGATAAVRDVLQEVAERSAAVKDISRDLEELNQTVVDMAALVEAQGETLGRVEDAVGKVVLDTHKGVEKLGKARRDQLRKRKCVTVGILLSIALLIILVVIVLVYLKHLGILP